MNAKLGLTVLALTLAGCGGSGAGGPPAEMDDDFPLPLVDGLAPTPPMGWNSWNKFACNITDAFVRQIADAMVSSGMQEAGFQYVNIDDCWSQSTRAADGTLQPDTVHFPNGIAPLADYVHGKGLKLGIYGDRGTETCGHRAGSEGYETEDATTFAAWGVDYLKYDNCAATLDAETQYGAMRDALDATGRPFVFSVCAWSFYEWAARVGNLQRTTTDITNTWDSIVANVKTNRAVAPYGGPNHWNDPDMLEVGNSDNGAGTVTDLENQSHFSLWAIVDAPLIAGNDLRNMSAATQAILTNKEVIAINQDALGLQGVEVRESGDQSVWAKPLNANGARAVVLFNAGAAAADINVRFDEIGLAGGRATVRDLLAQADLGSFTDSYAAPGVAPHGTATLKIVGSEPPRPKGTEAYLSDATPIYAANGLGPVERDMSNGASDPGDGKPIAIRGQTFTKGLGVAAPSSVIYRLGGQCTAFSATVGVDDATNGAGTVVFQVWADRDPAPLFDSGTVTGATPAMPVQVDVTGKRRLKLMVTNAGDGSALDRASWGDAKIDCAP